MESLTLNYRTLTQTNSLRLLSAPRILIFIVDRGKAESWKSADRTGEPEESYPKLNLRFPLSVRLAIDLITCSRE
jgi:hypothetical protein